MESIAEEKDNAPPSEFLPPIRHPSELMLGRTGKAVGSPNVDMGRGNIKGKRKKIIGSERQKRLNEKGTPQKVGGLIVQSRERPGRRVANTQINSNLLERKERCDSCGWQLTFPQEAARYIYQQCPLCLKSLDPPTALSIPAPHPTINDKNEYILCMARVSIRGVAKACERKRLQDGEYCKVHQKALDVHGELPYGRHDRPYKGIHPLEFEEKVEEIRDQGKDMASMALADSFLLSTAGKIYDRNSQKESAKKNITTESIASILEPTFGIQLKAYGEEKLVWLRESVQAYASLPKTRLSIIAATLGHIIDPRKSTDIAQSLRKLISKEGGRRLFIDDKTNILELLYRNSLDNEQAKEEITEEDWEDYDPCPGEDKSLRIRYVLDGTIAEVWCHLTDEYCLERALNVKIPGEQETDGSRLTIAKATYGHVRDESLKFDVTEKIQGIADTLGDTRYVHLRCGFDLSKTFGEPCTGIIKRLRISYVIDKKDGEILMAESHDNLLEPINIVAPIVAPALVVRYATLSPKLLAGRIFGVKTDAKTKLLNYSYFNDKIPKGTRTSIRSLDEDTVIVTEQICQIVSSQGGDTLVIEKGLNVFDIFPALKNIRILREKFRNKELLLHIEYSANGKIKSEKLTTDKQHILKDEAMVDALPVTPAILINSAVYGHPTKPELQFNVQEALEKRVRRNAGRVLRIDTTESLTKLFGDPCYPNHSNKVLQVRYQVQRMSGLAEGDVEMNGTLSQGVRIGWPNDCRERYDGISS